MNVFDIYFMISSIKKRLKKKIINNDNLYYHKAAEKDLKIYKHLNEKVKNYLKQDEFPLFKFIEIETHNRCNNNCSFCPVSAGNDTREHKVMSKELFMEIITQLKELNYSGTFALFSNNEPLIDERLPEFLKIAKENLPKAHHYIYTNALLLTIDKFKSIIDYLDTLYIDNYNDDMKMIPNVKRVFEYCIENPDLKKKVFISMRKKTQQLSSRAGQAPNGKKNNPLKSPCLLPFEQLIIRPDGKISLCCNDALASTTLGDITQDKIINIWRGSIYDNFRKLMAKTRKNISICKYCDFLVDDTFNNIQERSFNEEYLRSFYEKSLEH